MNGGRIRQMLRAQTRALLRDKTALFFTFLFPLMFLIVFGGLLGNSDSRSKTSVLVVGRGAVVDGLPKAALDIEHVSDPAKALKRVRDGSVPAVVEQNGNVVVVRYSATRQVESATVQGIVQAVAGQQNQIASGKAPRYSVKPEQVEDTSLKAIEFLTPGLLAWAISVGAVFGAALTLVTWRDKGILRRLRLSPLTIGEIGAARVTLSLGIAAVQVVMFIGVAVALFGLHLNGSWWMAIPVAIAGTLAFIAIGLLVGAFSKTVEAASAVSNLIVLPMAFLSGSFFPLDNAPNWVKTVADLFPLKHIVNGLTDVMVRGKGWTAALPEIGILLAFAAVLLAVATRPRIFRWDEA